MLYLTPDTCKYFGCELGAQTQMSGGRYIVNGAHEGSKLQEMLDGFIRRFVLCSECENPETDLVGHSWNACGHLIPHCALWGTDYTGDQGSYCTDLQSMWSHWSD